MRIGILSMVLSGVFSLVYAQNTSSPYHAIVAQDGSGNYTNVQAAVNAVPENRNESWCIFVKNGSYKEQVIIPKNKTHIHLNGIYAVRHSTYYTGTLPYTITSDIPGFPVWKSEITVDNMYPGTLCRTDYPLGACTPTTPTFPYLKIKCKEPVPFRAGATALWLIGVSGGTG